MVTVGGSEGLAVKKACKVNIISSKNGLVKTNRRAINSPSSTQFVKIQKSGVISTNILENP